VLAYDGALSFHRLTAVGPRVSVLSFERCRPFEVRGVAFQAVRPAQSLKRSRALVDEVEERTAGGRVLRVTSKERTLVDALDRLEHFSSVFELVSAFSNAGRLRVEAMVAYAERLRHPLTVARLGVVLETLGVFSQWQRRRLEALVPRTPVYFDEGTRQEQSVYDRRWQLLIPVWLPNALRGQGELRPERDESHQRRSPLAGKARR
jgi:predicted transcriptional regulator of viral defense system